MKFTGKVIKGVQVGSKFGIATANLTLDESSGLTEGVYLVDIVHPNDASAVLSGLLHFGTRKTFGAEFSVEVHILDFEADLYEQTLHISVLKRLRDVQAFPNADALFTQIETDIIQARKYFLRRQIRTNWESFTDLQRADLAAQALSQIESAPEFQSASVIYAFAPDSYEIPFVDILCKKYINKTWCFPRVTDGKMDFYVAHYDDLKPGYLDLLEPTSQTSAPAPDLIFVPAVAASPDGQRLGRGGGFYDQFLDQHKAFTIAVLPNFAVMTEIPVEKHDQTVEKVLKV